MLGATTGRPGMRFDRQALDRSDDRLPARAGGRRAWTPVQLFDWWAGTRSAGDYRHPTCWPRGARVFAAVGGRRVPMARFGVDTGELRGAMGGSAAISTAWWAWSGAPRWPTRRRGSRAGKAVQGNLDPGGARRRAGGWWNAGRAGGGRRRPACRWTAGAAGHIFDLGRGDAARQPDPRIVLTDLVALVHGLSSRTATASPLPAGASGSRPRRPDPRRGRSSDRDGACIFDPPPEPAGWRCCAPRRSVRAGVRRRRRGVRGAPARRFPALLCRAGTSVGPADRRHRDRAPRSSAGGELHPLPPGAADGHAGSAARSVAGVWSTPRPSGTHRGGASRPACCAGRPGANPLSRERPWWPSGSASRWCKPVRWTRCCPAACAGCAGRRRAYRSGGALRWRRRPGAPAREASRDAVRHAASTARAGGPVFGAVAGGHRWSGRSSKPSSGAAGVRGSGAVRCRARRRPTAPGWTSVTRRTAGSGRWSRGRP